MATLAAVKGKLGIPSTVTTLDADVRRSLDAADEYVTSQTGYSAVALSGRVEVLREVRPNEKIFLNRRPVSITSITHRDPGSSVESALTYDLVDAEKGELWLVPDATAFSPWMSAGRQWRGLWRIVTVTYSVTAAAPTADLADAVAELATFWYKNDRANVKSMGAGPFNTQFDRDRSVPRHVQLRINRYRVGRIARLVGGATG